MKESIQKTKQKDRTIQASGRNQKVGFDDKRHNFALQNKLVSTIQRLRTDISAEEASNSVIEEMNEDEDHSWRTVLLAGYGDVWVSGHSGVVTDEDRESITEKAEQKDAGCHICNTNTPGTSNHKFIPDHQPPRALAAGGYTGFFRFYPHCTDCSGKQGAVVNEYKRRMKIVRNGTDGNWATGISGNLFWR